MSHKERNSKFDKIHEMLAKQFKLDPRDVCYFRGHFYHGHHSKQDIITALSRRLPFLKMNKSYRYESYRRRLAFMCEITDQQWNDLTREYADI